MARREQLANDAESTLSAAINAAVTSISVNNGSDFPTEGNFRLVVDNEIMLAVSRSGDSMTVVRGVEGSAASNHVSGSQVAQILTKTGLDAILYESANPFAGLSPPYRIIDSSDDLLDNTDFTSVNGGSTVYSTDANGNIVAEVLHSASWSVRILERTAPTPPYIITAAIHAAISTTDASGPSCGIGFRENSTGELTLLANRSRLATNLNVWNFDSPTVFNAAALTARNWELRSGVFWFQIEDNNTDLKFRYSGDGIDFSEIGTIGRTSFMAGGPDRILFFIDGTGMIHNQYAKLLAWEGE